MPLALGLVIAACAPEAQETAESTTQEYESPAEAAELIAALAESYQEHYNLGQADRVADLYADDAIVQGSASEVSIGREAITASVAGFMTAMSPMLTIKPDEQVGIGDWILDRGSYANVVTPEGAEATELTGYYMSLSKRSGDGVVLHRVTVNFDSPPPMAIPVPEPMAMTPLTEGAAADLTSSWEEHYNAGDAAMVATHYADDAVVMFSERPMASGRAAIEAVIAGAIAGMSPTADITLVEALPLGDGWALNRGTFTLTGTMEGQSVTRRGTFMTILRQAEDGTWKIQWGISNAAPLATM